MSRDLGYWPESGEYFTREQIAPLADKIMEAFREWNNHGNPGDAIVDALNMVKELGFEPE